MPTILGPVNLTENEADTYTSSHLEQFAWTDDPEGSSGLLHVRFKHGGEYLYIDVPQSVYDKMVRRTASTVKDDDEMMSAGEYLSNVVKKEYDRKGTDYVEFGDILD